MDKKETLEKIDSAIDKISKIKTKIKEIINLVKKKNKNKYTRL